MTETETLPSQDELNAAAVAAQLRATKTRDADDLLIARQARANAHYASGASKPWSKVVNGRHVPMSLTGVVGHLRELHRHETADERAESARKKARKTAKRARKRNR